MYSKTTFHGFNNFVSRYRNRAIGTTALAAVIAGSLWFGYPLLTNIKTIGGVTMPIGQPDRTWPAPSPRSYWDSDGSLLYLEAAGLGRELIFAEPVNTFLNPSARPGDLLFIGRRNGDSYEGVAYHYTGGVRQMTEESPMTPAGP